MITGEEHDLIEKKNGVYKANPTVLGIDNLIVSVELKQNPKN